MKPLHLLNPHEQREKLAADTAAFLKAGGAITVIGAPKHEERKPIKPPKRLKRHEIIRWARKKREMSQLDIANCMSCSQAYIHQLETGKKQPTDRWLELFKSRLTIT